MEKPTTGVWRMGELHNLLEARGKQFALEHNMAQRDLLEAACAYMSDEDTALAFAYSGWAQCALPHRRIAVDRPWEVGSERMRLVVEPGRAPSGPDGKLEFCGVPFGAYARLILIYLQSQALRTQSREIELGGSWREWLGKIGVPWGGPSRRAVLEQAELVSRCRLTFHLSGNGRAGLVNQSIVDRALFLEISDKSGRQGRLSLETAKLSEGFYEQLKRHPIPLELSAIKPLSNNSAALDCYLWLAYRLHSLSAPRLVTWKALKDQHGVGFAKLYHFKHKFPTVLALAMSVYPEAKVDVGDEGIVLHPSPPPVRPRIVAVRG
jgi:Plasmid encoded RepA protein